MSIDNVADISPRVQYVASAAQTDFDYPFPIFDDTDLVVDVDGVTQAITTDYTVTGEGEDTGGTVTFVTPMTGGEIVTIYREMTIERTTDFAQNGPYSSQSFNDDLDRITLILQDLNSHIGRTLRVPQNAEVENDEIELAPIANWYDKFVYINSSGVPEPATAVDVVALTQAIIGSTLYPTTATETSQGITVVRSYYPPGNLKRYTANNGDGTDISAAFEAMLNCGEKLCHVPAPTSTWGIGNQVDWVSGVTVRCGRGTSFTSSRASGEWAFVFDGVPYGQGAEFTGFILNITNAGARGVQLWECRNVLIDNFEILGPAGIGGYGIEINGGDDASGTYGAAHNCISRGRVYRMAAGLRFYTDNTTTPASTTAFANRNYVYNVQAQSCTEGLFADRCDTNYIHMSIQSNTEGADIGQYAKNNHFHLYPESNTRQIVLHTSAQKNVFSGSVLATDFVDSGGSQVDPRFETACFGGELFLLPRDVTVADGGGIRLLNPFGVGSPIRMRVGDTYDVNLTFGSHDASDTNFDLLSMVYHATSPYASALRALTYKRTALTYGTTIATDASLGNFFDITVTDGVAFTISAPTIPVDGHVITYTIRNTSGGAVGTITWDAAFKMSTWTSPANGFSRSITFRYNGTNWVQINPAGVDIPN